MSDGKVAVTVRYALLYYFNKQLRLDVAEYLDGPLERPRYRGQSDGIQ